MADTKIITIAGNRFEVTAPYDEGHVVTAAEAKVLNQVRGENLGNNLRKQIDALKNEAGELDKAATKEAQKLVTEADATYEFTLATAGARRSTDPLEKEIKSLATSVVNNNIKEQKGMTVKAFKAEEGGEERYAELVAQVSEMPQVIERAKAMLAEKSALTDIKL